MSALDRAVPVIVDVGGTYTRITHSGEFESYSSDLLRCEQGHAVLSDLITNYLARHLIVPSLVIVGLPANFDTQWNRVLRCRNIPQLEGVDLHTYLESTTGYPVVLEHDAALLLLGDCELLQLMRTESVLGVYFGTGIGAALIKRGTPIRRPQTGFELGHIPVGTNDRLCVCGNRDCIEAYAGGRELSSIARRNGKQIATIFSTGGDSETLQEDLHRFVRFQAYAVVTGIILLEPTVVVIGGGVTAMRDYPREELINAIRSRVPSHWDGIDITINWANPVDRALLAATRSFQH